MRRGFFAEHRRVLRLCVAYIHGDQDARGYDILGCKRCTPLGRECMSMDLVWYAYNAQLIGVPLDLKPLKLPEALLLA